AKLPSRSRGPGGDRRTVHPPNTPQPAMKSSLSGWFMGRTPPEPPRSQAEVNGLTGGGTTFTRNESIVKPGWDGYKPGARKRGRRCPAPYPLYHLVRSSRAARGSERVPAPSSAARVAGDFPRL